MSQGASLEVSVNPSAKDIETVKGIGLRTLINTLCQVHLSPIEQSDPKPIRVSYTYNSLNGAFSLTHQVVYENDKDSPIPVEELPADAAGNSFDDDTEIDRIRNMLMSIIDDEDVFTNERIKAAELMVKIFELSDLL